MEPFVGGPGLGRVMPPFIASRVVASITFRGNDMIDFIEVKVFRQPDPVDAGKESKG